MARWYPCDDDCGASYRSQRAARMCCDRMLQAFVLARRADDRASERGRFQSPPGADNWTGTWDGP